MNALNLVYSVPGGRVNRFPIASVADAGVWLRWLRQCGTEPTKVIVTGTRDGVPFVKKLQTLGNQ